MPVYLGVNGEVKKISTIQYKNENGIVIEPLKTDAGMATFTTSGIFTVPEGVKQIDVFCVGGGGAGGAKFQDWGGNLMLLGSGGGSGYTKTVCGISVTSGEEIPVIVGAGQTKAYSSTIDASIAVQAGTSSCKSCSAKGGYSGSVNGQGINYSLGGSGGGPGGTAYSDNSNWSSNDSDISTICGGGIGGVDGGYSKRYDSDGLLYDAFPGQGTTTRAFGDYGNTCYAGGGGGGSVDSYHAWFQIDPSPIEKFGNPGTASYGGGRGAYAKNTKGSDGVDGTGGGGGGCFYIANNQTPSKGGDGIVIIRWGHQI